VNLSGADLRQAHFAYVSLSGADLSGADLFDVYFPDSEESADLRGTKADQRTIWPDGFDWRRAGIIMIP
jgi:uncharacterized protein YjbI with pentapeptide repeats